MALFKGIKMIFLCLWVKVLMTYNHKHLILKETNPCTRPNTYPQSSNTSGLLFFSIQNTTIKPIITATNVTIVFGLDIQ